MKPSGLAWVAATALIVFSASPVLAERGSDGHGWGAGGSKGRGAPAPLAAAGLPFLLAAGGTGTYRAIRRRLSKGKSHD